MQWTSGFTQALSLETTQLLQKFLSFSLLRSHFLQMISHYPTLWDAVNNVTNFKKRNKSFFYINSDNLGNSGSSIYFSVKLKYWKLSYVSNWKLEYPGQNSFQKFHYKTKEVFSSWKTCCRKSLFSQKARIEQDNLKNKLLIKVNT